MLPQVFHQRGQHALGKRFAQDMIENGVVTVFVYHPTFAKSSSCTPTASASVCATCARVSSGRPAAAHHRSASVLRQNARAGWVSVTFQEWASAYARRRMAQVRARVASGAGSVGAQMGKCTEG